MNCEHENWNALGAYCNDCGITDYMIQCEQARENAAEHVRNVNALQERIRELEAKLAAAQAKAKRNACRSE